MALPYNQRVCNECGFRATTSGTDDFVVGAALSGLFTPASCVAPSVVNGGTYYWRAVSDDKTQHELFRGTYSASGTTVARTAILQSSNSNAKVNFSAAPQVRMVEPSQYMMAGNLGVKESNHIFVRTPAVSCTFTIGSADITSNSHGLQVNDPVVFSSNRTVRNITSQVTGSPGVFTAASHGFVAGDPLRFMGTAALATGLDTTLKYYVTNDGNLTSSTFAVSDTKAHALAGTNTVTTSGSPGTNYQNFYAEATYPTGITEGTIYYVTSVATNTFQIAATLGGSPITPTGSFEGYFTWNTGNDQNDGSSNTRSTALLTIRAAVDMAGTSLNYSNNFYFNIRCEDSTYLENLVLGQVGGGPTTPSHGSNKARIVSEHGLPENCRIVGDRVNDKNTVIVEGPCYWILQGLWLEGPNFGDTDIECVANNGFGANLTLSSIYWGQTSGCYLRTGNHFGPHDGGVTSLVGQRHGYVGSCGGAYGIEVWEGGLFELSHSTVAMFQEPGYTTGYLIVRNMGRAFIRNDAADVTWLNAGLRGSTKYMARVEDLGELVTWGPLNILTAADGQMPGTGVSIAGGFFRNNDSTYLYTDQLGFANTSYYAATITPNSTMVANWTLTLPTTGGTSGYFMQTNGSGVATWALMSTPVVSVAGLPSPGTAGRRMFVSNATASTFAATVAGGGTVKVPVVDDGTNWIIG